MNTQEVDYSAVFEILEDIFGDYKNHNDYRYQVSFDCPVCSHEIKGLEKGDGKGNLEINYKYGVYKCWVCAESHETHGSIYKLIKKFGNPKQLKKYILLKPEEDEDGNKKEYKPVAYLCTVTNWLILMSEFCFLKTTIGLKSSDLLRTSFKL